jgi:hypothetical protein
MPDDEEDSLFGQEKEISQEQRISDKGKARIHFLFLMIFPFPA